MLDEILAFGRSLPAVRVISLDSRESYITLDTLRRILLLLGRGIAIRPILGVESADEAIRNEVLRKAMPHAAIDRVFRDLGVLAAEFAGKNIGLDVNIVIAGPGTNADRADCEAVITAVDALVTGAEHGVKVDLNLHPYYPSSRGSSRFPDHPRCPLATTVRAVSQIAEVVESMATACTLFIGWNDEGHDCEPGRRSIEIKRARAAFDRFNQTNDVKALSGLEFVTK